MSEISDASQKFFRQPNRQFDDRLVDLDVRVVVMPPRYQIWRPDWIVKYTDAPQKNSAPNFLHIFARAAFLTALSAAVLFVGLAVYFRG